MRLNVWKKQETTSYEYKRYRQIILYIFDILIGKWHLETMKTYYTIHCHWHEDIAVQNFYPLCLSGVSLHLLLLTVFWLLYPCVHAIDKELIWEFFNMAHKHELPGTRYRQSRHNHWETDSHTNPQIYPRWWAFY